MLEQERICGKVRELDRRINKDKFRNFRDQKV